MGQKIAYIAQLCSDDFYQQYADGTSFFNLNDFILRASNVAADYYRQQWKLMYDEIRQERRDEVVGFEPSVLSEQTIELKKEGTEWIGDIEKPAMSLPYDKQTSGISNVFDVKTGKELERSNVNETWQYQYQPYTNRLFYRIDRNKIKIFTKGAANVQEVRVLYVPSITIGDGEAELPDGMVNYVVMTTVSQMLQLSQGKIVKTSIDGNPNKIMESEINKESIK
jgi:hypothetical protein